MYSLTKSLWDGKSTGRVKAVKQISYGDYLCKERLD